jgi:hypothetical protein
MLHVKWSQFIFWKKKEVEPIHGQKILLNISISPTVWQSNSGALARLADGFHNPQMEVQGSSIKAQKLGRDTKSERTDKGYNFGRRGARDQREWALT